MSYVLIVDDEQAICWGLEQLLKRSGHEVAVASSAEDGLAAAARRAPELIVLDVRLPGLDGLTAMQQFRGLAPAAPIIVITAFGNLETAVRAVQQGAADYLTKPFDLQQAATAIDRALRQRTVQAEAAPLGEADPDGLLGRSPAMQEVFKRIALAAPTEAAVLISGESGTGKELVARAIHRHSARAARPLLPVNLAALNPTLVESELFGHQRGAFTGAHQARQGLLELAHQGTVFFDEAGDIPLAVQVKLLRVLEQHEVAPVGDAQPRPCDFRVIAATNRDLQGEVRSGRFRQDLYFRLAVFEIALPPLRDRAEDIPLLAEHFLRRVQPEAAGGRFAADCLAELVRRPWPGNVRELRNAVEHAALLARGGTIRAEHLPPATNWLGRPAEESLRELVRAWARTHLAQPGSARELYPKLLAEIEEPLFAEVLAATGHNRLAAAELLGIHRATLRKKLR